MSNYITFIRNYQRFGRFIRTWNAEGLMKLYTETDDAVLKKAYTIKMYEETISSTEDVVMWVYATLNRHNLPVHVHDVWELLLKCDADNKDVVKQIVALARIRKVETLLKRLDLPDISTIAEATNSNDTVIISVLNFLLKSIKATASNRTAGGRVLLLAQNKIKHGMLVIEEADLIRIIGMKTGKRSYKKRNLTIKVDIETMQKMKDTIEHNGAAVSLIITGLMADFFKYVKGKNGRFGKRQRAFLLDASTPLFVR
jgi:hypothetical protein